MIEVPDHAREMLTWANLAQCERRPLELKGLLYGVGISPKGAVIQTTDLDVDNDGPGGDKHTDPCWNPETSLKTASGESLDSRKFPGLVISPLLKQFGIRLGDFGFAYWDRRRVAFQVYDEGPDYKAGEGSVMLARALGVVAPWQDDYQACVLGNNVTDVVTVIFPGTAPGSKTPRPNHAIAPALIEFAAQAILDAKFTELPSTPGYPGL